MAIMGKHAITTDTPGNILLGAGTYHRDLKWDEETGTWTGSMLGATSGGGKISMVGEFTALEVDGALVKVKGLTVKTGGTCTIEVNFVEFSKDVLKMGTLFEEKESDVTGFTMLQDKAHITEGDYIDNFGFVGYTADGSKQIIVIFESAICTSGIELEPKNKENTIVKLTLEAVAENAGDLDMLPVKIYYPEIAVV